MKKIVKSLLIGTFMLVSINAATAQTYYKHSIGAVIGTIDGVSYKTFFTDNLALKADLGWGYPGVIQVNPNFMYQKNITSWDWGALDWNVGGGLSLGYSYWYGGWYNIGYGGGGKFGINALGGLELPLTDIPLTFDFDFRPGYGMMFGGKNWTWINGSHTRSYFDWAITWGIRYYFPL